MYICIAQLVTFIIAFNLTDHLCSFSFLILVMFFSKTIEVWLNFTAGISWCNSIDLSGFSPICASDKFGPEGFLHVCSEQDICF